MYFKIQKFTSQNLVYQAAVFCVRNAPKVTYERLRFEKFFRGYTPDPVKKGREHTRRERRGGEAGIGGKGRKGRREGKRVVPPRFKLVPPPLPSGWLRPCVGLKLPVKLNFQLRLQCACAAIEE
jgi:hypothetical protein